MKKANPYNYNLKPMLATLTDKAFDSKDWVFEIKFDGYRVISKIFKGSIELVSRNYLSFNELFPQIRKELKKIKRDVVLDGEVVILDDDGIPEFQLIQNYKRTREGNIVYYVFDILWYENENIEQHTLLERKKLLQKILPKSDLIQYSEHIPEKVNKHVKDFISKPLSAATVGKIKEQFAA